jgi:hypothetical protein
MGHPRERRMAFEITWEEWLKVQLRLAALEQNGARLNCRLDFPGNPREQIVCHIYFTDDDVNSIRNVSPAERIEIYEGWISFGTSVIRRGFELSDLSREISCRPEVKFVLYECGGMSAMILQTTVRSFAWPESDSGGKS